MGVLIKNNVAGKQPHPMMGIGLGNLNLFNDGDKRSKSYFKVGV